MADALTIWWRVDSAHDSPQLVECVPSKRPTPTNTTFRNRAEAWVHLLRDRSLGVQFAAESLRVARGSVTTQEQEVITCACSLARVMEAKDEEEAAQRQNKTIPAEEA